MGWSGMKNSLSNAGRQMSGLGGYRRGSFFGSGRGTYGSFNFGKMNFGKRGSGKKHKSRKKNSEKSSGTLSDEPRETLSSDDFTNTGANSSAQEGAQRYERSGGGAAARSQRYETSGDGASAGPQNRGAGGDEASAGTQSREAGGGETPACGRSPAAFRPQSVNLQEAVIWAEILGEPVSRKRRRRRVKNQYGNQGNVN